MISDSFVRKMEAKKLALKDECEAMLHSIAATGREELTPSENRQFKSYVSDIEQLGERIEFTKSEVRRAGDHPFGGESRQRGAINSAGRLAPLSFDAEQLRSAHTKIAAGGTAVLESRASNTVDPLLPPQLFDIPLFPRHENRLVDRLPGLALDAPSIEYLQVTSVSGTAAIVGESQLKPEVTMPATKLGTVASLAAVVAERGWTTDAVLVAVAGTGLTFGMWWVYFVVPAADLLHAHRDRSFGYGYSHIVLFASIVATGAGLHSAAYYIEHRSELDSVGTVVAVAVPVGVYIAVVFATYLLLVRTWDAFYALDVLTGLLVLSLAVGLAVAGISTTVCLLVVMAAPAAIVASFELFGHRQLADVMARHACRS
jgi:Bacterial low temperature requirement A protein (LtrA)